MRLKTADGTSLGDDCVTGAEDQCVDAHGGSFVVDLPANTSGLDVGVYCGQSACVYGPGPAYDFAIAIYSSEVTIEENTPPTATLTAPRYGNADTTLTLSGSDALGVRKLELLSGDTVVATSNRTCVDWSVLPCSEPSAGLGTSAQVQVKVKDTSLQYGEQNLRLRVTDGAGNVTTTAAQAITLDTRAPSIWMPTGAGVSSAAERELGWQLDQYDAPVTSASIHLCTGTGDNPSDCRDEAVAPAGPYRFTIGGDGATATATITLTDAAGNSSTSNLIRFSRDATAPAAPVVTLTGGTAADRDVTINGEAGTKIDAKVCAVGGGCVAVPAATAPAVLKVSLPGGGDYDIVATLTDAAGNVSAAGTLRLTRNPVVAEPKSMALAVKVTSNLRKGKITISGSVAAGSTRRIDVQLIGKSPKGKRVTRTAKITVPANGKFTLKVKPPRGASVRKNVQLVLTPKPADGWRVTHYTHTIRP